MGPIAFDISRLISRSARPVPTGIDRVEMAYARHLIETARPRLVWTAMTEVGRFGEVPAALAEQFIAAMEARWSGRSAQSLTPLAIRLQVHAALSGETALHRRLKAMGGTPIYLLVSHHHLDRPASIERLRTRTGARFICFVHDLIPMELPEYAREGQAQRHAKRMDTVARLADGVIVNSRDTGAALAPLLAAGGRAPQVIAAHIGFDPPTRRAGPPPADPYFIYVATLEPRKNHLLLLKLWRGLAAELGAKTPKLVLVGQRGWNIANLADMLDRSEGIRGHVEEHNRLSDAAMEEKLIGARALLFPAFAEGFGLPLAEALARRVPAVASDLAALREVGQSAPEYLDPLDGPAWRSAILDYADPDHPRRRAQVERIKDWRPPTWADHFAAVAPFLT